MATWGPTQIADTNNDCDETGGFVNISGTDADGDWFGEYTGPYYSTGLRWPSVPIAAGDTITSATLDLYITYGEANTNCRAYGVLEANPGVWTETPDRGPDDVTVGTVYVAISPDGTGWKSYDVTTVIQDICNNTSRVANNALAIAIKPQTGVSTGLSSSQDYGRNASLAAKLTIVYTAAGGTILPMMMQHHGG